ncbi:MAG: type IV pilus biogenesis protein PilP, partial [Plesiomonas shigelloides]
PCMVVTAVSASSESEHPLPPTTFTRAEAGRALNLGQLEAIQAETVLYEAQLARAKALSELQRNGYDRPFDQPFNPAPPSQDNTLNPDIKSASKDHIPPQIIEITGIRGVKNGYSAVLVLNNGNVVTVETGHRIPGTGFVVKRININEVVVSGKNKSLLSLSFTG